MPITETIPSKHHIVAYDFGIKRNILRLLAARGCLITVVPVTTTAEEALSYKPDGIFLSNGPGDPAAVSYAIENIRQLIGKKPLFGICLGHQILALALGAQTYKLKFGHRGGNQPVQVTESRAVQISSHNHGFAVDANTLPDGVTVSHVNLNDSCCEGLVAPRQKAFSVQYHPESSPGPHDSDALFDRFVAMMDEEK
jgi:carbamoyl-phosphate synthase small subunit